MALRQFRTYTDWHHHVNAKRYDAPADPWKLLQVDPTEVTHYTDALRLDVGLGRVQAGDWDREKNCRVFRETTLYRGLQQRFAEGRDWEDTDLYARAKSRFERGETVRGYDSLAEYRRVRCAYVDDLYRRIEREGYRPNEHAGHAPASDDNPVEDAYANHLEPLAAVARDGSVRWVEGYHRLAIADLLDLAAIPAYVLCRHADWQRVREEVHATPTADLPPNLAAHLDHPDLRDVRA